MTINIDKQQPIKISTKKLAQDFLDKYDTFLFDCDGVLWSGSILLPKVKETLKLLAKLNKQLIFVTNNSTKSRKNYTKKFASFGIDVTEDQIIGSSYATATYIHNVLKMPTVGTKIWIVGESGIEEELKQYGYETIGGSDEKLLEEWNPSTTPFLPLDPNVKCVVVGLDTKINYHKLCIAFQYLTTVRDNKETLFIATNNDSTFPSHNMILPGVGSIVESLVTSTGRNPIICGKPYTPMLDALFEAKPNLVKERCCMVGDRLNTDIKFGIDGKLGGTLLVLTGIETEQNLLSENTDASELPKYYANKLGDLYELIEPLLQ
ncbi:related to 4-nitrophenylphosphatase [Saccharomycodes ludwigii]|uniref:4-nitrophenylphosphatase n=1 Tax=Saccharomycodes ludwigii TaxID=36035 RepID=A0A376B5N4_9ASCO|nr:related to 4-nitrophenylphosphatase [Saccharomycodes ludwigii]